MALTLIGRQGCLEEFSVYESNQLGGPVVCVHRLLVIRPKAYHRWNMRRLALVAQVLPLLEVGLVAGVENATTSILCLSKRAKNTLEARTIYPDGPEPVGRAMAAEPVAPRPYKPTYTSHPKLGGECRFSDVQMGDQLGSGSFGSVYQAIHKPTGRTLAIKKVDQGLLKNFPFLVANEEIFQHDLKHKNIGKIYCAMMPGPEEVYLAMPLSAEGSLTKKLLKGLPVSVRADYVAQILKALHFTHSQGVAHLDVKPDNILLTKGGRILKLIDFGIAHKSKGNDQRMPRGTQAFLAPEVTEGRFGQAADYYSLAQITYLFYSGDVFDNMWTSAANYKKWLNGEMPFASSGNKDADELIHALSIRDPVRRYKRCFHGYSKLTTLPLFKEVDFGEGKSDKSDKPVATSEKILKWPWYGILGITSVAIGGISAIIMVIVVRRRRGHPVLPK